jgi:mRNA-degrading endonuclease RelE of RelBE toxin-antitoxin system
MVYRGYQTHNPKFQRQRFGPYRIQYRLLNNTILLTIIDKFDHNQ